MKPIRLLAAGMGLLVFQAALATDRLPAAPAYTPVEGLPFLENNSIPQPADVANRVGVAGLHLVAAAGIALSVMARRRKAGR